MNLLNKLVSGIKSVEHTMAAGLQPSQPAPNNDQNKIQPGHKLSPAVEAQNSAPIRNEYNSKGQPTQEILSPAVPTQLPGMAHPVYTSGYYQSQPGYVAPVVTPHFAAFANGTPYMHQQALPQITHFNLNPNGHLAGGMSPNVQGQQNPGYIPLQHGGSYMGRVQPGSYRPIQGTASSPQNPYSLQ